MLGRAGNQYHPYGFDSQGSDQSGVPSTQVATGLPSLRADWFVVTDLGCAVSDNAGVRPVQ